MRKHFLSTHFNLSISIVIAAILAICLPAFAGTAHAAPMTQINANVLLTMPTSIGDYNEEPSQSWVWMYQVAPHGAYTGTVGTALNSGIDIGMPGSHELRSQNDGSRSFRGSAAPGDYLMVAHLGPDTLVMNQILTLASGDQLPQQTHTMTWSGTWDGTASGSTSASNGAAEPQMIDVTPTYMAWSDSDDSAWTPEQGLAIFDMNGSSHIERGAFESEARKLIAVPALMVDPTDPDKGWWVMNTQASTMVRERLDDELQVIDLPQDDDDTVALEPGVYDLFVTLRPDNREVYVGRHVAATKHTSSRPATEVTWADDSPRYPARQTLAATGAATSSIAAFLLNNALLFALLLGLIAAAYVARKRGSKATLGLPSC